jgi:alkylhydroperoxidase family enzyme
VLELVRILIGVVPNCDPYLEIWPPAFRTYNIMVPNFLNLPFSVFGFGGAPKELVSLGMYVSSRAAECPYCSAHTCSFALRRGASPEKVAQALVGGNIFRPEELATIAVARSLARIPCELTEAEREALEARFSPAEAEWIVMGIVMMGFLNKFMDAISVELEASSVAETRLTMGTDWSAGKAGRDLDPTAKTTAPPKSDTLWKKLSVLPHAPGALRLDKQWQQGVPDAWPAVGEFLRQKTGHNFPVLSRMQNARAIRAVASMLRENFNSDTTVIGLETKVLAGIIFAAVVADEPLAAEVRVLGSKVGVSSSQLDEAKQFVVNVEVEPPATDPKIGAALVLARAASPSPAEITASVVEACRQAGLSSPAIVELVAWLSVLQMLHRLSSYFVGDRARQPS